MLLSLSAWLAIANGESESSAVGRESPPYMVREMWGKGRDVRRLYLGSRRFLSLCMWEEGSESNDLPTDESCMMSMSMSTLMLMLMLVLVQLEVAGNRGSPQKHTDKGQKLVDNSNPDRIDR